MQVTISLLPVSLSLVHIPRSRLDSLSRPVLRQLLQPNPAFLNVTCNEIELSLFAEHHMLLDFEPVARKDRLRQRSTSGSTSRKARGTSNPASYYEPVEISCEKWSVLQIDSHSDQIDSSGTRVYDLSAPLAAAGISILYQSSYMSDFIFVKESRLQEALNLFSSAGFHLYTSNSHPPISPTLSSSFDDLVPSMPVHSNGAVLTRDISDADLSTSVSSLKTTLPDEIADTGQQLPRTKSHSPSSSEVRILQPDLACVGLSDELGVDHWGLKIVKLVAFPDLIIPSSRFNAIPLSSSSKNLKNRQSSMAFSSQLPFLNLPTSPSFRGRSNSDTSSSSDEDGYFSHSPRNISTASLTTNFSRSFSDLQSLSMHSPLYKSPSKHIMINHLSSLSPIIPNAQTTRLSVDSDPKNVIPFKEEPHVPFFSFTRTPEGSSLTADVHVLATLFPPHERHMVICSGELDAADLRLEGADLPDGKDEGSDLSQRNNFIKCLQIDLRRFGLDKHGLVNRFSRVLQENCINHMYSSTFKTANLLVDKRDAIRAQCLLRAC